LRKWDAAYHFQDSAAGNTKEKADMNGTFLEYLPSKDNQLATVWRLASQRKFAILSLPQDGIDQAEIQKRMAGLRASIRSWGAGFFNLTGCWLDTASSRLTQRTEQSVFLSLPNDCKQDLHTFVVSTLGKDRHRAAIFKPESSGKVFNVFLNGDMQAVGLFSAAIVAKAYALAFKPDSCFRFTRAEAPDGWAAHMVAAARSRQARLEEESRQHVQ